MINCKKAQGLSPYGLSPYDTIYKAFINGIIQIGLKAGLKPCAKKAAGFFQDLRK